MKLILFSIILVTFSCLSLLSLSNGREVITSYCSDCTTINFIPTIENEICWFNVTETQACLENNTYAYCASYTDVEPCRCPNASVISLPDPYNVNKYIKCDNSIPTYSSCADGLYFNPEISACVACVNTTFTYTKVNCSVYNITTNCGSYIEECNPGWYFDEDILECVTNAEFQCSTQPLTGLYPDTKNCSIYHQCVNRKEPGGPFVCTNNTVFNGDTLFCDSNTEAVSCDCQPLVPKYVVCMDGTSAYPTKNCKRYYQCKESSPGVYVPKVQDCLDDLQFNPQLNECAPPLMAAMCENGILQILF